MLSTKENERLTRVGPGTPMGDLLRQYWHPIGASEELRENPTKSVRILGESLVLYRDRSGTLGLLQESCPHRRVNLLYGIRESAGGCVVRTTGGGSTRRGGAWRCPRRRRTARSRTG